MIKKAKIAVPLLIAVLAFSGCSDATSMTADDVDSGYYDSEVSTLASTSSSSGSGYNDYSYSDDVSNDTDYIDTTDDYSESTSNKSKSAEKSAEVNDTESTSARKLIRTKSVTVETKNLDKSIEQVNTAIDTFGAYVEYSTLDKSSYDERRTYSMTIRVPEDKLDAFMTQLDSTGTVTSASENTEDVTLKYTDIEAHKKALKTEYDRVMELLEKAETMDQILALESKLSDLRYQLDSYESQLKVMDNQITYSTVSLTLREVEYEKDADTSYGTRVVNAFKDGMHDMKQGLEDFSVWFILILPSLVVLLIVIAILVAIGRAIWKKTAGIRAKKRAERAKVLANRRVPRGIKPDARGRVFGTGTDTSSAGEDSNESRVDDDK